MVTTPDLTVIVPVFNAAGDIENLVTCLQAVKALSIQVILVDDCSEDDSPAIINDLATRHDNVIALHHEENSGAGVARNTAFPLAEGRYTLFFDADDVLHPDTLVTAIQRLDRGGQDVAVCTYRYQRDLDDSHQAMNSHDLEVWHRYVGTSEYKTVTLAQAPRLLDLTNYPWNKIIRTDTFRAAGIKFGSTTVHNDILGHWYSLLFAERILLLQQPLCTHIVLAGGSNLTNRGSRTRLQLFTALDETYALLSAHPELLRQYSSLYWRGVIRIAAWAKPRVAKEVQEEFLASYRSHLKKVRIEDLSRLLVSGHADLANKIVNKTLK